MQKHFCRCCTQKVEFTYLPGESVSTCQVVMLIPTHRWPASPQCPPVLKWLQAPKRIHCKAWFALRANHLLCSEETTSVSLCVGAQHCGWLRRNSGYLPNRGGIWRDLVRQCLSKHWCWWLPHSCGLLRYQDPVWRYSSLPSFQGSLWHTSSPCAREVKSL